MGIIVVIVTPVRHLVQDVRWPLNVAELSLCPTTAIDPLNEHPFFYRFMRLSRLYDGTMPNSPDLLKSAEPASRFPSLKYT